MTQLLRHLKSLEECWPYSSTNLHRGAASAAGEDPSFTAPSRCDDETSLLFASSACRLRGWPLVQWEVEKKRSQQLSISASLHREDRYLSATTRAAANDLEMEEPLHFNSFSFLSLFPRHKQGNRTPRTTPQPIRVCSLQVLLVCGWSKVKLVVVVVTAVASVFTATIHIFPAICLFNSMATPATRAGAHFYRRRLPPWWRPTRQVGALTTLLAHPMGTFWYLQPLEMACLSYKITQ